MTSENTRELPDTVENAAATPGQDMPWKELGLKEDEYQRICDILGRRPTNAELAMYSVMWSEHCSYKSSKKHLAEQFGARTTDAMRKNLLVGMGQNAGVVDIGGGWAVTFKVESHNHPSFVEPYQGAATGVGGIVRDIISMGARPIAVMDQLRFGAVDHPDTARVVHGVVSGVGGYGNCLGLPNIGGETEFDPSYQGNPLVNALCIGKLRHDDIHLANATGEGNLVVLFGARTGGDGIGGASILASETFEDGMPAKRPSVQVGDPFMEKVLIECCLDLFEAGVVQGIQDLGAAGISCATSELASNGDSGMHVDLENVLLRDPTLTAGEIMALVQYVTLILMSLMMISMIFAILPRTLAATERINAVLSTESTVEDVAMPTSLPETAEDSALRTLGADIPEETTVQPAQKRRVPILKMDHVSFRYPESKKDALSDLTFELAPNTITALVGPTGSGKSSLINLIMRMYDASAGTIYFDGVAIKDIPLSVLRTRVSYTPQKSFLFTGTVADNLRFADPDASDEALWRVLSIAQATEFITQEAGGLDFEIAQGGGNLSGGQRQRIAIARGLLRKADLYIFDDSFSALDLKTDARVRAGIEDHLEGQSVLTVTQRVNVALGADQIILLNETGAIEACGTHAELFLSCPAYRELALSQLSEEELSSGVQADASTADDRGGE